VAVYLRATVSLHDAQLLVARALDTAQEHSADGAAVACAVVGSGGELVAFAAHDACAALPRTVALRKAHTALALRRSTTIVQADCQSGRLDLDRLADADLLALPGGIPIVVDGAVVGAIGVSGLTAEQDADLAAMALTVLN
jgi:glc operon protein GlcG